MSTDDTNTLTFGCSDAINNPRQRQSAVSLGPVFMGASGLDERIYALYDANWDITAITDTGGNVLEQFVYSPYGVQTVVTPAGNHLMADGYNWVYGFQGERTDPVTGEVESASREKDPTTGTWNEQDPAGYVNGANTYQFVGDDPATCSDPSGCATTQPSSDPINTDPLKLLFPNGLPPGVIIRGQTPAQQDFGPLPWYWSPQAAGGDMGPYELGTLWLRGAGANTYKFNANDYFTRQLEKGDGAVQAEVVASIAAQAACRNPSAPLKGTTFYTPGFDTYLTLQR